MQTSIEDAYSAAKCFCQDSDKEIAYLAKSFESLVKQARTLEAVLALRPTLDGHMLRQHPALALTWVAQGMPKAQDDLCLIEDIALLCLLNAHTDSAHIEQDDRLWSALIEQTHSLPLPAARALMKCLQAHQEQGQLPDQAVTALETAWQSLKVREQPPAAAPQSRPPTRSAARDILGEFFKPFVDMHEQVVQRFEEDPLLLLDPSYTQALNTLRLAWSQIPDASRNRLVHCMARAMRVMLSTGATIDSSVDLQRLKAQAPEAWWVPAWHLATTPSLPL